MSRVFMKRVNVNLAQLVNTVMENTCPLPQVSGVNWTFIEQCLILPLTRLKECEI